MFHNSDKITFFFFIVCCCCCHWSYKKFFSYFNRVKKKNIERFTSLITMETTTAQGLPCDSKSYLCVGLQRRERLVTRHPPDWTHINNGAVSHSRQISCRHPDETWWKRRSNRSPPVNNRGRKRDNAAQAARPSDTFPLSAATTNYPENALHYCYHHCEPPLLCLTSGSTVFIVGWGGTNHCNWRVIKVNEMTQIKKKTGSQSNCGNLRQYGCFLRLWRRTNTPASLRRCRELSF